MSPTLVYLKVIASNERLSKRFVRQNTADCSNQFAKEWPKLTSYTARGFAGPGNSAALRRIQQTTTYKPHLQLCCLLFLSITASTGFTLPCIKHNQDEDRYLCVILQKAEVFSRIVCRGLIKRGRYINPALVTFDTAEHQ